MPTLHWIGKEKIVNHHLEVPFRTLRHEHTHGAPHSGNRILHGDNLEALKALLPEYEGRVKCIYIDPPYNTGNEGWAYNDNVSDPRLLRWLHKTVGKEGEDLSRHDKWLCMMYPRLKLLHKLLAEDGAIFISIDDNEQAHLRLMMDEIFGGGNFITTLSWFKKVSPSNDAKYFSNDHEFVCIYAKKKASWKLNRLVINEKQKGFYKNPDNDSRGVWNSSTYTCNKTADERPNLYYPIENPFTKEMIYPSKTAVWAYSKDVYEEHRVQNLIYWGVDGKSKMPRFKKFLTDNKGVVPRTIWLYDDVGHTQEATQELQKIINTSFFSTPKPPRLIERILQIATTPDSLVLDSFAGSGTTAHAVLNLNREDGGNRKFILIEMENYADTLTAERVRRVIDGYVGKPGTGGGFDFYTLGAPLFDDAGYFHTDAPEADLRRYVWHAETRAPWPAADAGHPWKLGTHDGTDWWFCYDPGQPVSLDLEALAVLRRHKTGTAIVAYADYCTLPNPLLTAENIRFKKIPRDVPRL